ncbi:MAG: globin [Acidimicrobiales bacterium]|nr:globin [Acidimicrobiales bacterium]
MSDEPETTVYDLVGGTPFFVALVDRFYADVAEDPVLRPMYPDDDLAESKRTLTGFLIQYWGGPDDYSQERGHPRLRMRHQPFEIGEVHRDAWYRHMSEAVVAMAPHPEIERAMLDYFAMAADAMVNTPPIRRRPS